MFIVTNKAEVKKRIRNNRLLFWAGVACLVGSIATLLVSSGSTATAYAIFIFGYPLLFLGIFLSKRGSYNNRRLGVGGYKIPPEEIEIEENLKGVPPRFHLYNYINIGGIPIEHMLVTPQGIIILNVKGQIGKLRAGRDLYRMKRTALVWLSTVGEPGIGNPSQELSRQVKRVRSWMENKGYDIPTDGIVILNNPRASIDTVEDMSFPVCMMKDLKLAIREWQTELNMVANEQQEVEKLIIEQLPPEEQADAERDLSTPASKRQAEKLQEEREEAIKAARAEKEKAREKARAEKEKQRTEPKPANTGMPVPGQKLGLNGKPLPPKPVVEKKRKRSVEPLQRPNPGAFGEPSKRKK